MKKTAGQALVMTSGLSLTVKGIGDKSDRLRFKVRVHTVGHLARQDADGLNLSSNEMTVNNI